MSSCWQAFSFRWLRFIAAARRWQSIFSYSRFSGFHSKSVSPYFVEHRLHISDEAHPLKVWHGHVSVRYEPEQTLELVWTFCLVIYFGSFLRIANVFTPGKRLMRIRVMSLTHDRIGPWHALERTLGYGASLLEGGFGFFQYFLYHNHVCAHDRLAETIVVSLPRKVKVKEKNPEKEDQAELPTWAQ